MISAHFETLDLSNFSFSWLPLTLLGYSKSEVGVGVQVPTYLLDIGVSSVLLNRGKWRRGGFCSPSRPPRILLSKWPPLSHWVEGSGMVTGESPVSVFWHYHSRSGEGTCYYSSGGKSRLLTWSSLTQQGWGWGAPTQSSLRPFWWRVGAPQVKENDHLILALCEMFSIVFD